MKVGNLVRTTGDAFPLWKKGDIGLVVALIGIPDGNVAWVVFPSRKRRMDIRNVEVVA